MTYDNTRYYLSLCTNRLGSSAAQPGHANLKHCFAMIHRSDGSVYRSLSFGSNGVKSESNHTVNSTVCQQLPSRLSSSQIQDFIKAFESYGKHPYRWGSNDCCTVLSKSLRKSLSIKAPRSIELAVRQVKQSRSYARTFVRACNRPAHNKAKF